MTKIRQKYRPTKFQSKKHCPHQLSFNQDLLIELADSPQILLLYLKLRRFARHRHGSFKAVLSKLSTNQRYKLLPQLVYKYGLTTFTKIKGHRNTTLKKYGRRFVKVPNSVNTKKKIKAFIIGVAENIFLQTQRYQHSRNKEKRFRDQERGYTVLTGKSSRHRQSYTSVAGCVTRAAVKQITGYSLNHISGLRKYSLNKYQAVKFQMAWMENDSTYFYKLNTFLKFLPRELTSKIHSFTV